jgi:hypothetical protein
MVAPIKGSLVDRSEISPVKVNVFCANVDRGENIMSPILIIFSFMPKVTSFIIGKSTIKFYSCLLGAIKDIQQKAMLSKQLVSLFYGWGSRCQSIKRLLDIKKKSLALCNQGFLRDYLFMYFFC